MPGIKSVPAAIVLAGVLALWNPLDPANADDQRAALPQAIGLAGVRPVGIDQQPRRTLVAEIDDDRVEDASVPWWIGDETCDIADQSASSILTFDLGGAWLYVPCGDTDMAFAFEVPNQVARPGTRFTKSRLGRQKRQQR